MHSGQNFKGWSSAKWLGSRGRRSDGAWVVDRFESERWTEVGRYGSKPEAEAELVRMTDEATGDASVRRIARRPRGPEPPRGFVWALAAGLAVCALVVVVLVVSRS